MKPARKQPAKTTRKAEAVGKTAEGNDSVTIDETEGKTK
jgi:hypothetical protein